MDKKITKNIPFLILRIGLGFVFFWFSLDKLINPENWLGYITPFLFSIIPFNLEIFILILGIIEFILGIILFSGYYLKYTSIIVAMHLIVIILSQGFNEITVRDIGLLAIALALATGSKNAKM